MQPSTAEGDMQESFTILAGLIEKEEYEAALAMVRSSLPTRTRSIFQSKLNKIEANILLASSLGSRK